MHERISINSLCFPGRSLAETAEFWRELGCKRVSLVADQLVVDPSSVRDLATTRPVAVESVAHVLHSGALTRSIVSAARERLAQTIDAAAACNARSVYLLTGARGSLDWEAAADLFCETVSPCIGAAHAAGVALLVENAPFLYCDFHFVHSLADAITLARLSGIGLCVDVFGCWTEAGLSASLVKAIPYAGLVQLSDFVPGDRALPARAVLGDGAVPIEAIVKSLVDGGYRGAFDIELLGPRIDAEGHLAATRRSAARLGEILDKSFH